MNCLHLECLALLSIYEHRDTHPCTVRLIGKIKLANLYDMFSSVIQAQ